MPMLGRKQDEWPRFRDCFITEDNNIAIYTRVGGGNRNAGYNEEKLYEDPLFIKTYDDEYDNTYATYEFRVPEKWKADFDLILEGRVTEMSEEYKTYLKEFFPTLTENGFFNRLFNPEDKL
jgi:hypothetical protein